jgi:hypothetical protein
MSNKSCSGLIVRFGEGTHGARNEWHWQVDAAGNGEAFGLSINFGPIGSWVGFNCAWQEAAFQAFRAAAGDRRSPGVSHLTLIARNPASADRPCPSQWRDKSSLTPVVEDW